MWQLSWLRIVLWCLRLALWCMSEMNERFYQKNKLVVCFEPYCGGFNADVFQCRLLSEPASRQSRTDRNDVHFTMSERARDRCQLSCQVCTGVSHHGPSFCRRQRQVISFNSLNAMYRAVSAVATVHLSVLLLYCARMAQHTIRFTTKMHISVFYAVAFRLVLTTYYK